jgi:hypothetical protein
MVTVVQAFKKDEGQEAGARLFEGGPDSVPILWSPCAFPVATATTYTGMSSILVGALRRLLRSLRVRARRRTIATRQGRRA